jgi:hypothetical protein
MHGSLKPMKFLTGFIGWIAADGFLFSEFRGRAKLVLQT